MRRTSKTESSATPAKTPKMMLSCTWRSRSAPKADWVCDFIAYRMLESLADAVRKPESLRLALRDMWRLAYGPPTPLTAQRWGELEPYFERIKQAHAAGKWRFVL